MAPRWAESAFDGVGASRAGGRWNSRGVRLDYLGGSLALTALELLVHLDHERALKEFVAIPVEFDSDIVLDVQASDLPEAWGARASLAHTQAVGDAWIARSASAILAVPSRVVPEETNYLYNPDQADAGGVRIGRPRPFRYDPRLLSRWPGRPHCP